MDPGANTYTPGGSNPGGRKQTSSSRSSGVNDSRRSSRPRTTPPDLIVPIPQGETNRTLSHSTSLAPSARLKHYASLLVAEKPAEVHREFQRKLRTGSLQPEASLPVVEVGGDMMDTLNAERRPSGQPNGSHNARSTANDSPSPFVQEGFGDLNGDRIGGGDGRAMPSEPGQVGAEEEDLDADATDPEYEAYRKAFKQGFMYKVVKGEIVKNKRRRGRSGYLATLKSVYSSIVPSGGRRQPLKLSAMAQMKSNSYIFAMVVFDRVTPTLLGLNASLIVLFMSSCMVLMSMFAAGQSRAWHEAVFAAEGQTLPPVEGQKNWGPSRLWSFFVKDNNKFGQGVYMTEWGGVGAVILNATEESFRYITAVFVHDSIWHLLLVGGCCAVSGVLVERRYGIFRTLVMTSMLCISSSMSAVLFNERCSVSFGSSPLAWGYLMWWIIDTASRVTLWPLRDRERLWKMVTTYKNLSNIILLISTTLTLLISEASLATSSAPPSIVAAVSALLITPIMAPRWSTSALEAATVPVAFIAVIIFWVIIPLAGAGKVSGVTEAEVSTCGLISLEPV